MKNFMLNRVRAAGMTLLAALLVSACEDEPAPVFEPTDVGTVEGWLFLDADDNGFFDPIGGDEPVAGVTVALRSRGTDEVIAGATAVTGADGRFTITGVPVGTHDLFFDAATLPEGVTVCANPVPVSVRANLPAAAIVPARAACLITIEEAQQAAEGAFVVVRGVVTSAPNQIDNSFASIEDETGGIFIFSSALAGLGIENGDLIEVGGTIDIFDGRLELVSVDLREHIPDFQPGGLTPAEVTTAEIAAAGDPRDPLQNRLVVVRGAQLVTGFTTGGSRNATINDGSGATIIRVEDGVSAANGDAILTNLGLTVGDCYDIVGIVGAFNTTAQLFPRSAADFTPVTCPAAPDAR